MVISHKYKFIFIKSTKVGGTSLELMLDELCGPDDVLTPHKHPEAGYTARNYQGTIDQAPELAIVRRHMGEVHPDFLKWTTMQVEANERFHEGIPAWQVKCRVPPDVWSTYFKFTIERNPWDKAISRYFHSKSVYEPKYGKELTFDAWLDFLERILSRPWVTKTWGSEAPYNFPRYADPWTDEVLVDKIIRYEQLEGDVKDVFERLGMPWPGSVPRKAKTGFRADRRPYKAVLTTSQAVRIEAICAKEIALMGYLY